MQKRHPYCGRRDGKGTVETRMLSVYRVLVSLTWRGLKWISAHSHSCGKTKTATMSTIRLSASHTLELLLGVVWSIVIFMYPPIRAWISGFEGIRYILDNGPDWMFIVGRISSGILTSAVFERWTILLQQLTSCKISVDTVEFGKSKLNTHYLIFCFESETLDQKRF